MAIRICVDIYVCSLYFVMTYIHYFSYKFGLYEVDFDDPERKRTAKRSAYYYKQVIATRCVLQEEDGFCEES